LKKSFQITIFVTLAAVLVFWVISFTLSQEVCAGEKIVIDQLGRKVRLPVEPRRVVSLAPNITEMVFSLGKEGLLKGATRYSDYPAGAEKIPRVGSYVYLDLEKIVALKPDLCIATKDGNPISVVKRLEALNIPVYAVDPRDLESVMNTLVEIGGLIGASEKANIMAGDMRRRVDKVKSIVKKAEKVPGVFFQIGVSPIVSAGTRTFIHELIVMAGGKNLAQGPVPYPHYSREEVLALSPEVFIITSMERGKKFEKIKSEWARWSSLPAVKNGRILLVDSNVFDRPGPRLVDGLEILAGLIHPELFEK
jgi:iron complex transport system substrate-binding protein